MSSSEDIALRVSDLTKVYRLYEKPVDRLKELLLRRKRHADFVALRNVSFSLPRGRTLGVVGDNGAGKSTLLQLIAGSLTPTSGYIQRNGSALGLLELGLGFHVDFTGRENILLYGDVLGLPRRLIQARLEEIIAFSELEGFIDRPLKTYSTGMRMRLAFSLVASLNPDILIVDEALAVGDMHFQKKCIDHMTDIKSRGQTIIFCSHSLYQMSMFCDQVLWLKEGTIHMLGETARVLTAYEAYQMEKDDNLQRKELSNSPVRITQLKILNDLPLTRGETLRIYLFIESVSDDLPFHVTLSIKMDDGRGIYVAGTHLCGKPPIKGRQREILITYPKIPLLGGIYSTHARVLDDKGLMLYHDKAVSGLEVRKDTKELGICYLENHWQVN